ncbi:hypothetical protein MYCTH_2299733 [Thermothelomyces thermophilus ATCC 42464]|uniref:BTB domain-containing protein n=1 Tax=Thermothelomyces thermophilus (strain ATCC 42464 / BCRC 31852 / DSM 1799) TaxID=573729 RepID=G2Q784_THET4|nr:uncharacterized protein MYCTH_2299733 [Thermothelomyces thermophilus ATCC 42464]AEO55662.1 hypothetical protein MYCTH_2299733 [Thermothelomyces thermophilus ATCC 42464]
MATWGNKSNNELLQSLDKLFKEGTYSDLTITCGNDEYKVHKAIICPRSSFFAKACDGLFQEGNTGVVSLPDDDPQAVRLMMHYFYHLDYPRQREVKHGFLNKSQSTNPKSDVVTNPGSTSGKTSNKTPKSAYSVPPHQGFEVPNLTIHARLYALAEKYDVQGLKALALEKFKEEARIQWDSDDFIRAAEEAYTSTVDRDRGMRDAVVEAIREHSVVLDKESMQNVVRRFDLCFDLMMRFRDLIGRGYRF